MMSSLFLIVLLVGVVTPLGLYLIFRNSFQWEVSAIGGVFCFVIASAFWFGARSAMMSDVEIWNGKVTSKASEEVSCEHSYSCHCRTDKDGHETCDTCYEHRYDVSWYVQTTIGTIEIDRVNRRGDEEPPRFTAVKIDEPVAQEHIYKSYIKAVPQSLFHEEASDPALLAKAPEYPRVYDYYRINRVLVNGKIRIPQKDIDALNNYLSGNVKIINSPNYGLKNIGVTKEVNVVVIFTDEPSSSYVYAIEKKWIGGKKNDVVVVIGVTDYPVINWVETFTWARNIGNENFQVILRDAITDLKTIDPNTLGEVILTTIVKKYDRPHNRAFEYLDEQISPPTWAIIWAYIFVFFGNIGVGIFQLYQGGSRRNW